jgi:group I intron endonuclease
MNIGIYTITNLLNKKMLIGQSKNVKKRLNQHLCKLRGNYHENSYLQKSFNKYKEENFEFSILVECDESLLYSEEHYWAMLLNVHNKKYGYNILSTHPYKQINNRTRKYENKTRKKGNNHSEQAKKRMSEARIKYLKENLHPFLGKKLSEEHKSKISKSLVGKNFHTEQGLINIKNSSLKRKKSKEEIEKIKNYHLGSKRTEESKKRMKENSKTTTVVLQYDLDGNFIKEWERIRHAADFYNCDSSAISACCRNKCKTVKNFIWKYKKQN